MTLNEIYRDDTIISIIDFYFPGLVNTRSHSCEVLNRYNALCTANCFMRREQLWNVKYFRV